MTCDDVEYILAVLHAAAAAQRVPEHDLRLGVVHPLAENETATGTRVVERPSGERVRDRAEEFAEFAEDARTDDVAIILEEGETGGHLPHVHGEMVLPEIGERFDELTFAHLRAHDLRRLELVEVLVPAVVHRLERGAVVGRELELRVRRESAHDAELP